MNPVYDKLLNCLRQVREKTDFVPEIAIILGSGLGDFAETIDVKETIYYKDIKGFPVSTVSGHAGCFVLGYCEGAPVIIMQGRVHYYEGYDMSDVVLPVRLMGMLGAKKLILTNAAGGINKTLEGGSLMLLTGQISTFVPSPLKGPNIDELGTRFPDMSEVYSKRLRRLAKEAAGELNIDLKEGVYVQASGPNYESPEEIRMFDILGADAVGMSTACEAVAARHMGFEILGISCITNMAAGISSKPLSHEEVKETADKVSESFKALVRRIVRKIKE